MVGDCSCWMMVGHSIFCNFRFKRKGELGFRLVYRGLILIFVFTLIFTW